jgi:hypothetical protein
MEQREALQAFDCFFGKPKGRMDTPLNGAGLRFFQQPTCSHLASGVGFCFLRCR